MVGLDGEFHPMGSIYTVKKRLKLQQIQDYQQIHFSPTISSIVPYPKDPGVF